MDMSKQTDRYDHFIICPLTTMENQHLASSYTLTPQITEMNLKLVYLGRYFRLYQYHIIQVLLYFLNNRSYTYDLRGLKVRFGLCKGFFGLTNIDHTFNMKLARFVQFGLFVGLSIHTSASGTHADVVGDGASLSTRGLLSGIQEVTTCAGCEVTIMRPSNLCIIFAYQSCNKVLQIHTLMCITSLHISFAGTPRNA